jgi:hypothetical protein
MVCAIITIGSGAFLSAYTHFTHTFSISTSGLPLVFNFTWYSGREEKLKRKNKYVNEIVENKVLTLCSSLKLQDSANKMIE